MSISRRACIGLATLIPGLAAPPVRAQDFPARAVRIITPLSAGSQADLLARMVAQKLAETWGRPVVVENHAGGAGQVAGQLLLRSPADGHTLMLHSDGHVVSAAVYGEQLAYDTLRDFARVSQVASSPSVLVVGPGLGIRSVAALVALGRSRAGGLSFGSAGVGGGLHFTGEMFKQSTGIEATHIPFRGTPEALTETMAGRIDFTFSSLQPALPLMAAGNLLALAVSSPQRSPVLPQLPTVAESGYPGFGYDLWWGLFAPSPTPAPIQDGISRDVARVLAQPELRQRLLDQGIVPVGSTPAAFDAFVRAEVPRLRDVARVAGIRPG
ncbi:Bug family tripartite tricarboxylate transporter substrate binding protein [Plastoroseomonas arctica]|uniref:Tripartite tricarboxylate transporter substrate binding protein n=1 Tax=Plastoroseomonas arctica TaxID=1509237 RepID=A0AAF1K417_9PROT|nr:tripartite tricarboxylate transporter substrate binding protein [Plastoroseomonas arctica]MBR0655475.1 tripartite tricarboxylate transporter substrate binding protein [Plastoroseomonas arctica]